MPPGLAALLECAGEIDLREGLMALVHRLPASVSRDHAARSFEGTHRDSPPACFC